MGSARSVPTQRRLFLFAVPTALLLILLFGFLLGDGVPADVRQSASAVGLLVAGLVAAVSCGLRARQTTGRRRRTWRVLTAAAGVAIASNVWTAAVGADPVDSPSSVGELGIAAALLLSIYGLLNFPSVRRRGVDLVLMALDGLVAGGAVLVIASVLVYSELLDATSGTLAGRATTLLFPVLDVVLATVALLLVLRGGGSDRPALALVAGGFIMYAVADLAFAVSAAQGTFEFGTTLDLGWIAGYLLIGLAAWYPSTISDGPAPHAHDSLSDARGTVLLFGVLLVAGVVQVGFEEDGLPTAQALLWLILIVAAGARQVLLAADNAALRRGLERRVREQTADLRRLARQTEVLLTSVGDGIYGVDHDGRVTFVNPSGAAALGHAPDALLGRHAHDLFHAPDENGVPYPWEGCYVTEAIRSGLVSNAEEDVYLRADGEQFPVEITASPVIDEDELQGAVVVFRDVTQRREIDQMKNEFLSVVSHELRTPLTSIRGSLGLLAGGALGELNPRAASMVQIAVQSSERLTRLINDLLDIERIESGSRPMEVASIDAGVLVSSAVRQIQGMAAAAGVRVEAGSCSGRAVADEDRIMQTLTNLLGNAIKYSHDGGLVVADAWAEGHEVVFRVRDEGRGIPVEKLESIFERFEQVDSSDARQKGGTGLGLAISRSIVQRHGGRIWAESELGAGTTLFFTLPSASPRPAPAEELAADASSVLVCDDDHDLVEVFLTFLRRHGYRAVGVSDGQEALARIRRDRPSAVLLDLVMPGTSGAQVMEELKNDPAISDIPVVVVSGLGPETNPQLAPQVADWLVKPVSEGRLVTAVVLAVGDRDRTVLLVEDDRELADVLATLLERHGLTVVHAATSDEAIDLGRRLAPSVMILDLHRPEHEGAEVIAAFRGRRDLAQTAVIVFSAEEVEDRGRASLRLGETFFLAKDRTGPDDVRDRVLQLVSVAAARRHDSEETPA